MISNLVIVSAGFPINKIKTKWLGRAVLLQGSMKNNCYLQHKKKPTTTTKTPNQLHTE